jgi:hypothetical protein
LEGSELEELRRDNVPRMQASSSKPDRAHRGRKAEAFETLKIFQGEGRSTCSRRSYNYR